MELVQTLEGEGVILTGLSQLLLRPLTQLLLLPCKFVHCIRMGTTEERPCALVPTSS